MKNQGTPKTLEQAIANGRREAAQKPHLDADQVIANHVQDFQAQKITHFTLSSMVSVSSVAIEIWASLYPQRKSQEVA